MQFLITGGAGFIGSHFVEHIVESYDDSEVVVVDKLTYAGHKQNLSSVKEKITFVKEDIANRDKMRDLVQDTDVVVNFAAESHVDRSIESGDPFVQSNVRGAQVLMDVSRQVGVDRFVQISTDEVYGSIREGKADEAAPINPSSPYSASKAAADMFANAFHVTYGLPVVTARPTNNYGPRQNPEKLIPKFIQNALAGDPLPLYGDGLNVRDWLYVKDTCAAIEKILELGEVGETYNIGADNHLSNLEVTQHILNLVNADEELITFVEDRKGHDQRYAVDSQKLRERGWKCEHSFLDGLESTVDYYRDKLRNSS